MSMIKNIDVMILHCFSSKICSDIQSYSCLKSKKKESIQKKRTWGSGLFEIHMSVS